jgi:hypothetical protein
MRYGSSARRLGAICLAWLLASSASAQVGAQAEPSPENTAQPSATSGAAPAAAAPGDAPPAPAAAPSAPVEAATAASPPPPPVTATAPVAAPAPPAAAPAPAVDADSQSELPASSPSLPAILIHGFVSEGGFVSTSNDFIGASSRGSLKFLDAGVNFSVQPLDQLRVGLQVVARRVGTISEDTPRLDWAVIDYRLQSWLGLRAGLIKIPLGLYNEYEDIDSARTAILLPQSLYPIRNRDALLSHIGFALYGNLGLGAAGELDYQAWTGTLTIPRSALQITNATLDAVDAKYAAGGQLFWHTPLEGLRVGASFVQASIDFDLRLDSNAVMQLVAMDLLPAGSDGKLVVSQRPDTFWVGSAEYSIGAWLFAAEYARSLMHQQTTLPELIPTIDQDSERFYGMVTYRLSPLFELGTYYSVLHPDVHDRTGKSSKFSKRFLAFQRDLAATIRFDVNDYWLWKLEGHFIDGAADLDSTRNPHPHRYWGLFLARTTVTF